MRDWYENEPPTPKFVILNEVKNLSLNHRAPGKADPFLRGSGQAQVLRFAQDKLRMTTWAIFIPWVQAASLHGRFLRKQESGVVLLTDEEKAKTLDPSSQSLARIRFCIVGDDGKRRKTPG